MYTKEQVLAMDYDTLEDTAYQMRKKIEEAQLKDDYSSIAIMSAIRSLCFSRTLLMDAERAVISRRESIAGTQIPDPFPDGLKDDLIAVLDKYNAFISIVGGWNIHLGNYNLDVNTYNRAKHGKMRSVAFPGLDEDIAALNRKYNLNADD